MKRPLVFALVAAIEGAIEGAAAVTAEASSSSSKRITLRGYRQTRKPASKGGTANNRNGFRFRNAAMRPLARSFRGQPFITAHDWGDARARAGTILDAWIDELTATDELAINYEVEVTAEWALEGLSNRTIDRFSLAAQPTDECEVICTIHGKPVWTECACLPREVVDGKIAEWEYTDVEGLELSSVNVPAVGGTGILDARLAGDASRVLAFDAAPPELDDLVVLCGRSRPTIAPAPSAPPVPIPSPVPSPAAAVWSPSPAILAALGLPEEAGEADITARLEQNARELAAVRAEQLRMHVDAELARLVETREVDATVIATLRETAVGDGLSAFERALKLVLAAAPALVPAARSRPVMQSDSLPVPEIGSLTSYLDPDAFDQHSGNPDLPRMMRLAGVTVEDVRKHGPRRITVVPNLAELAAATDARGGA